MAFLTLGCGLKHIPEVLEINLNILLIWNRLFTLSMHIFLNILSVINY